MYAKPDQVLEQQSQYLLTVTNSVRDNSERSVGPASQFTACLEGGSSYCNALSHAVTEVLGTVSSTNGLAAASVFTTLSATDWVEKAYAFVNLPSTPVREVPPGNPAPFSLKAISRHNLDSGLW